MSRFLARNKAQHFSVSTADLSHIQPEHFFFPGGRIVEERIQISHSTQGRRSRSQ
jgi:hypothetical protein